MPRIATRNYSAETAQTLADSGITPLLARVYAARGVTHADELAGGLTRLLSFETMKGITAMAVRLADAIVDGKKLLVVADYDADGATACAVAVRGLQMFGARVEFIVPNRFEYGYGLTPQIVQLAARFEPDVIVTVDNGIASVDGVAEANRLGIEVLVTDHHLPGDELPDAACIVNPNQPGCPFPSKNLAGVGVMFYVLLSLRAELRQRGAFNSPLQQSGLREGRSEAAGHPPAYSLRVEGAGERGAQVEPNLATLLDLVALGTVADVVKLDQNNRILVQQGLARIRAGRGCAGINALLKMARKQVEQVSSYELGFVVGPRLNAAGRLEDMSLGIRCLLTDEPDEAAELARQLDELNRARRDIEADMQESALAALEQVDPSDGHTLTLYNEDWHQGVIGILASRLKDRFHRPVIAFARANEEELKGSGRSIPGLHLRDALDLVSKRHPQLIQKFGGHAMAAGVSVRAEHFEAFRAAFEAVAQELLSPADLTKVIETDGELTAAEFSLEFARSLEQQVWGQGFPQPSFEGEFGVASQRVVGEKHLKLKLEREGVPIEAIMFNHADELPPRAHFVYSLSVNEYNGRQSLQLVIQHCEYE